MHSLKEEPEKEVMKILDVKLEQPDDIEDDNRDNNAEYPEKFEMVNEEEKKQASPPVEEKDEKQKKLIEKYVYETLMPYKGAISAEHGIGMEKREWLSVSRTPEEINLMKQLKNMMDPIFFLDQYIFYLEYMF